MADSRLELDWCVAATLAQQDWQAAAWGCTFRDVGPDAPLWLAAGMLAGGTGITPMYQVARAVLQDPKDTTNFSLIFGNLTEDDILIRDLLDDLARQHPDRCSPWSLHVCRPAGFPAAAVLANCN